MEGRTLRKLGPALGGGGDVPFLSKTTATRGRTTNLRGLTSGLLSSQFALDLNDFKGTFSFDYIFNKLAGDILPAPPPDADAPSDSSSSSSHSSSSSSLSSLSSSSSGSSAGGPSSVGANAPGFPKAEDLLPRFKGARRELLDLSKKVDDKLTKTRREVALQDREHKETLGKLEKGVESLFDSFSRLDSRISGVGQTAARIGDHLQSADAQRETASQIIDLVKYLMDFNRDTDNFEPHAHVFLDDTRTGEAAAIVAKLCAITEGDALSKELVHGLERRRGASAGEDEPPTGLETAVRNLQDFCNELETKLLSRFDLASKKDVTTMADCAKTLDIFKRGNRAMHRYVTTRAMFLDPHIMQSDIRIALGETGSIASVKEASNPVRGLIVLYKQIAETMREESVLVQKVFPSPKNVMKLLTERVMVQRVQNVLEQVLRMPNPGDPPPMEEGGLLLYLRTMVAAYDRTMELAKQFLEIGCGDLDVEDLAESLFSHHKDMYLEMEKASLMQMFNEKYFGELNQYMEKLEEKAAAQAASVTSMGISSFVPGFMGGISQFATGGAAAASSLAQTASKSRITTTVTKDSVSTTLNAVPSLSPSPSTAGLVSECITWNEDGIQRSRQLFADPQMQVEHVAAIFKVLLEQIGTYSIWNLERAIKDLQEAAALKDKFSLSTAVSRRVAQAAATAAEQAAVAGEQGIRTFLNSVKRASSHVAMGHKHFLSNVSPVLMSVEGAYASCVTEIARQMENAEAIITRGMGICMDTAVGEVERLLSAEQKPSELRPPEDGSLPDHRPTRACFMVVQYLEKISDICDASLEGPNKQAFLTNLGTRLHKSLLTHIQKFTLNPAGGLRLKRDVSEYAEFVRSFKSPPVDELFEVLSTIVNLFIVAPESLRTLVDSSHMNHKDALVYLQLRDDYRSARIAAFFQ